MTNSKFELVKTDSITVSARTLYRIRVLVTISGVVKKGELGGDQVFGDA